ncbi:hypothetical protein PC117_g17583 [Phytophthora cactorum]|uniref:FAD-binding FR-type domain-containing protein n=1 Tax=Phytophthora cactorum TaxID=29920 RepID=A0A8T1CAC1_9STRA|nr:hypothetical protein PC117_g17583 [Phytophthora cactorum]
MSADRPQAFTGFDNITRHSQSWTVARVSHVPISPSAACSADYSPINSDHYVSLPSFQSIANVYMSTWAAGRLVNPYMIPDMVEPEAESTRSPRPSLRQRRHSSSLWRNVLATTLKLLATLCFVLFIGGQAAYVSPLYKNHIQSIVATWWGPHKEMVDPSYLLLVGVAPTIVCVAVIHWLRRLRTQRKVWRVTRILRRRPSPDSLSYGELLFLLILVTGNALVFWYGFTKKHGHKPRFTGDPPSPSPPGPPSGTPYIKMTGNALGFNCVFNMALLFIPATRNSVWMEFMNISYANGIKFHRWLGVAAIVTGIVHFYLVSRVISHCNGVTAVKIVEFTALSPSLCKLVIAHTLSERGRYQVGQFVYLNVPAISRLEWHAFTIASSPKTSYESSNTMTLLIKALGDWTEKLMVYQQVCTRCSIEPEVYVDGYYGVSLAEMYQTYNTVVLVGGGVGITPLLGILDDICIAAETRQAQGRNLLPRRVAAIFTMRELELLKEIYPLLARVRELDPHGRYISVDLTLTATPRPEELDFSLADGYKTPRFLPSYSFSQTQTFSHLTKKKCPFGSSLARSGISMLHFIAFGIVMGIVTVCQFDNGMLIGLQDNVWVVQLSLKTSALFAAVICVYSWVVLMRWIRTIRATYKLKIQHPVHEWSLRETLLPQAREQKVFNPDITTFRDLNTIKDAQEVGRLLGCSCLDQAA